MSTGVETGRRRSRWHELSCLQTCPQMGSKLDENGQQRSDECQEGASASFCWGGSEGLYLFHI